MSDLTKRLLTGILIGVVVGGLFAALYATGRLDSWEARSYDWRVASSAHFDATQSKVVMFYVDQASLDFMKHNDIGWPWPRALYADVLQFAKTGGARAVVFDLIYSEDSVYGVADDAAFAAGLSEVGNGYMAMFMSQKPGETVPDIAPILERSAVITTGQGVLIPNYAGFLALPIPPLMQAAKGFGNVQFSPDSDGVYRRLPLLFGYQGKVLPSLYIGMLHGEHPESAVGLAPGALGFPLVVSSSNHPSVLRQAQDERVNIPLDAQGNMVLKFYGGVDTFPNIGLAKILTAAQDLKEGRTPSVDPSIVKDKVVIVGVSAPGLYDLRPQPMASRYPGAEIHATAFQNILTGDFMRVTPAWIGVLGVVLLGILLGVIVRLDIPTPVAIGVGVMALIISIGLPVAFIYVGWWVPMVAPAGAVVGTFVAGMVLNYLAEGKKKRMIRSTFQKYLAPDVVKSLLKNPDAIALGGAEKVLTVYFSDIAGFTDISEKISPQEVVEALNHYLTRCSQIVIDSRGTIDKYIGDAVMAFWGAPLPMSDHAEHACFAALKVQKMLKAWNEERVRLGKPPLATRIGIHTGTCVVGNMGSTQRMNYTVMGDTVNLASRLEGLNKFFGTQTIASGDCVATLRDKILCRHLAAVRVKGRSGAVEIYELRGEMATASDADHQFVAQFEKGLSAYRDGRLDEARQMFEELARSHGDVTSKRYVQWINAAARSPIGSDWDGVVTFDSK